MPELVLEALQAREIHVEDGDARAEAQERAAAAVPKVPAPRMAISAGGTPGTPGSRMPLPPRSFCSSVPATCGTIRPARWLSDDSTGSDPSSPWMVS